MIESSKCVLAVIDCQGKLAASVLDAEQVMNTISALIQTFRLLKEPIIITEQAPEKIGSTIPSLMQYFKSEECIAKQTFSCVQSDPFKEALLRSEAEQVIICGIETHVCVLQTAMEVLDELELEAYVCVDAVSSQKKIDHTVALKRLNANGVELVTAQMVITELLRSSGHARFREVMSILKQNT